MSFLDTEFMNGMFFISWTVQSGHLGSKWNKPSSQRFIVKLKKLRKVAWYLLLSITKMFKLNQTRLLRMLNQSVAQYSSNPLTKSTTVLRGCCFIQTTVQQNILKLQYRKDIYLKKKEDQLILDFWCRYQYLYLSVKNKKQNWVKINISKHFWQVSPKFILLKGRNVSRIYSDSSVGLHRKQSVNMSDPWEWRGSSTLCWIFKCYHWGSQSFTFLNSTLFSTNTEQVPFWFGHLIF